MKRTTPSKRTAAELESPEAIGRVDDLLASVGLIHGTRASRRDTWQSGERKPVGRNKTLAEQKKRVPPAKLELEHAHLLAKFEKEIVHAFSTRAGGVTRVYRPHLPAAKGDLNLGYTKHDERANVEENRKRLLQSVAGKDKSWKLVTLHQKHTPIVRLLDDESVTQMRGDAILTQLHHRLIAVMTADCVPVLLYDPKHKAIGAFHAGWRGTLARIVERGVGTMRLVFGSNPADLIAAIGPSIGPCCYSVGEEVRHEFMSQFEYASSLFTDVYESDPIRDKYPLLFLTARAPGHSPIGPQLHLNLWEANRRQLLDAGLSKKNISVAEACTACGTSRYFSHRSEQGFTGRMMSVIGLR